VHDFGGKLTVSIDLEVDGDMALTAAHDIAHELEREHPRRIREDVEVDTHIEPLETGIAARRDAAPDRVKVIKAALARFAADGAIMTYTCVRVRIPTPAKS